MTKLCPRGKAAAKRKFAVYPSAYANAYASKICAGKIKDPSGTKRKDFKGPKPAGKVVGGVISTVGKVLGKKGVKYLKSPEGRKKTKEIMNSPLSKKMKEKLEKLKSTFGKRAGGMTAGSMSGMGRLQKARMMNKGGGADSGRRGEFRSKLAVAINKIKRNRPTRPDIKKIKQKFQSEKDLPRSMRIDTTTSAYGDAGKGRPVPKYQTGGPADGLPRTRPGQSPRGVKPRDPRYRAEPYRAETPKANKGKRKKAFKIGGLVDYYKDLM